MKPKRPDFTPGERCWACVCPRCGDTHMLNEVELDDGDETCGTCIFLARHYPTSSHRVRQLVRARWLKRPYRN